MNPRPIRCTAILVLLLLAALSPTHALARDTEVDFQQWAQIYVDGNLDNWVPGLRTFVDLQARRSNAPLAYRRDPSTGEILGSTQSPNTLLLMRPAVGYQFTEWLNVFVGYAWQPVYFDDSAMRGARNVDEHRIFQQLGLRFAGSSLDFSGRTRLEQRVRTNGPGSSENDGGDGHWAHRFRQQARVAWTIAEGSPWQIIASDEVFVHLNRTNYPTRSGIDQNRAFLGVGYDTPGARVEVGYTNQFVHRFTDPDQINHVLTINLIFKLRAP